MYWTFRLFITSVVENNASLCGLMNFPCLDWAAFPTEIVRLHLSLYPSLVVQVKSCTVSSWRAYFILYNDFKLVYFRTFFFLKNKLKVVFENFIQVYNVSWWYPPLITPPAPLRTPDYISSTSCPSLIFICLFNPLGTLSVLLWAWSHPLGCLEPKAALLKKPGSHSPRSHPRTTSGTRQGCLCSTFTQGSNWSLGATSQEKERIRMGKERIKSIPVYRWDDPIHKAE